MTVLSCLKKVFAKILGENPMGNEFAQLHNQYAYSSMLLFNVLTFIFK